MEKETCREYMQLVNINGKEQFVQIDNHDWQEVETIEHTNSQKLKCQKCGDESFAFFGNSTPPTN